MKRAGSIQIIVKPDGKLTIDAIGFEGADCEKATGFLEEALGQPGKRDRKPEYYRRAQTIIRVGR